MQCNAVQCSEIQCSLVQGRALKSTKVQYSAVHHQCRPFTECSSVKCNTIVIQFRAWYYLALNNGVVHDI